MVKPELRSPLTVQKVNGIIRAAGLPISTSRTTAVKGWHETSSGYRVTRSYEEKPAYPVNIRWQFSTMQKYDYVYERAQLQKVADHLRIVHGLDAMTTFGSNNLVQVRYKDADPTA